MQASTAAESELEAWVDIAHESLRPKVWAVACEEIEALLAQVNKTELMDDPRVVAMRRAVYWKALAGFLTDAARKSEALLLSKAYQADADREK